jgi:biopolymer transport protein TolR
MARRRRDRLPLNAEINVVSLIDVMMLLLIIFMIAAPMMQGGVEIALPVAEARAVESRSNVVVSVDRDRNIWLDRTRMSWGEFRGSFRALVDRRARDGVYLQADSSVDYGFVVRVLAFMRNNGVPNVHLIVEPEAEK